MANDGLSRLPEEVLDLCCQYARRSTLRSLRLTNRMLSRSASKHLFGHATVHFNEESVKKLQAVRDSSLNSLVSQITFYTSHPDDVDLGYVERGHPDEAEMFEGYENALTDIGVFQNVRSVELRSGTACKVDDDSKYGYDPRETESFRMEVLNLLMHGINHENHPATKVRESTIVNLQDNVNVEKATSENFKAVLSQLNSLRLNITYEQDSAAEESDLECNELHQFFKEDLKKYWLLPLANNLQRLELSANLRWGLWPECDLRDTHFPKLQSLILDGVSFWPNFQLEFILSHSATLEKLTLEDCCIVQASRISWAEPKLDLVPGSKLDEYGATVWNYDGTWHDYFHRIKDGLPNLKQFAFEIGSSRSASKDLPLSRYCIFDEGSVPPWMYLDKMQEYENDDGETIYGGYPDCDWEVPEPPTGPDDECHKADKEALEELLAVVRSRK